MSNKVNRRRRRQRVRAKSPRHAYHDRRKEMVGRRKWKRLQAKRMRKRDRADFGMNPSRTMNRRRKP